jgi:hypothetical protein
MEARDQLSQMSDDDRPGRTVARSAAAWLARSGMVALVVTEEATEPDIQSEHPRAESEAAHHLNQPSPHGQTDEARLVRLSAQKLWAEGRANPVSWVSRTWIGDWLTDDRVTWRTTDGHWLAQLQRSQNGQRVFLRVWRNHLFVGYQDLASWHPATTRSRTRQPRPVHHAVSLPLPLAG